MIWPAAWFEAAATGDKVKEAAAGERQKDKQLIAADSYSVGRISL